MEYIITEVDFPYTFKILYAELCRTQKGRYNGISCWYVFSDFVFICFLLQVGNSILQQHNSGFDKGYFTIYYKENKHTYVKDL